MINESNSTDALDVTSTSTSTNLDLGLEQERQTLPFKNEQIAMLEERLSKQSVELASLRAREDEQKGNATPEDVQADLVDNSVKSSRPRRDILFGFMPGWGSKGGVIGNMIKFDKKDRRNEDLRVGFPTEGRRRTIDKGERPTVTVNAEPVAVVHREQGQGALRRSIRRRSRKLLHHLVSSRKIGSTVLFPREDDDYSLGFD